MGNDLGPFHTRQAMPGTLENQHSAQAISARAFAAVEVQRLVAEPSEGIGLDGALSVTRFHQPTTSASAPREVNESANPALALLAKAFGGSDVPIELKTGGIEELIE